MYDPRPTRTILVRRGIWLYIVVRLFVLFPLAYAGDSLVLPPASSIWLAAAVGALAVADVRRRREALLFANLGVRSVTVALAGALPAIAGEFLIAIVVRLHL